MNHTLNAPNVDLQCKLNLINLKKRIFFGFSKIDLAQNCWNWLQRYDWLCRQNFETKCWWLANPCQLLARVRIFSHYARIIWRLRMWSVILRSIDKSTYTIYNIIYIRIVKHKDAKKYRSLWIAMFMKV